MHEEILKIEEAFGRALVANDVKAIGEILADDWIIIDPDGGIIDKARFLGAIGSGALSHEAMDASNFLIRTRDNTVTVTALTTSKGRFMGQEFTTQERATDVFVREDNRWQCMVTHLTRIKEK